jgi:hypothetical protein
LKNGEGKCRHLQHISENEDSPRLLISLFAIEGGAVR